MKATKRHYVIVICLISFYVGSKIEYVGNLTPAQKEERLMQQYAREAQNNAEESDRSFQKDMKNHREMSEIRKNLGLSK